MVEFDPVLVHEWLDRSAKRFAGKDALVCGDDRCTYGALGTRSETLAAGLQSMGVERGGRVVVFLDNSIETVVSMYGILKAGGVFVIVNGGMKAPKLAHILRDSGAAVMIAHTGKARVVEAAVQASGWDVQLVWIGKEAAMPAGVETRTVPWESLQAGGTATGENLQRNRPRCIDADLAALIYTSGSTGEPKGVMSTHHNVVSAARSIIQYIGNREDDIILDVLPLSFDYGLYQVIMSVMFGGTVVIEKSFIYLHAVLQRLAKERVTGLPIVPTVAALLLRLENIDEYDFSSLRYMTNTGAALPAHHIRQLRRIFPHLTIFSMFGLTECKRVCYLPPEHIDAKPGSVGRAMPNCEVFVVDGEGNEVAPGETGELVVRGANVMQGYWNSPGQTAAAYEAGDYPEDRRLRSGDRVRIDEEGFLYFLGREDDMIKSKGERISPREIEDTVCALESVSEAAVIGVPDEVLGQAVKLFVVPTPGGDVSVNDLLKYCKDQMESFVVPKFVEIREKLPHTPNGKVDKKALSALPQAQSPGQSAAGSGEGGL